jgi:hypothetical protein
MAIRPYIKQINEKNVKKRIIFKIDINPIPSELRPGTSNRDNSTQQQDE